MSSYYIPRDGNAGYPSGLHICLIDYHLLSHHISISFSFSFSFFHFLSLLHYRSLSQSPSLSLLVLPLSIKPTHSHLILVSFLSYSNLLLPYFCLIIILFYVITSFLFHSSTCRFLQSNLTYAAF